MFSVRTAARSSCRGQRSFLSSTIGNVEVCGRRRNQRQEEIKKAFRSAARFSSKLSLRSNDATLFPTPKHYQQQLCQRPFDNPSTSIATATIAGQLRRRPQFRNMMARSSVHAESQDPSLDPEAKAMTFLVGTLGHEKDVAKGVLDALKQSGVSGGPALLSMVRTLAGRWEVDEDAGLEALVESVTVELARSTGKKLVTVWILPSSAWASKEGDDETIKKDDFKRAFKVEGFEDMSLTDVAKFGDGENASVLGEMIECSCSGIMACSTCHVVVHSDWFEKVGEPEEAELDMIDLAYNAQDTSRLGCQVILKPNLENAIFKIPIGANNMMDFIPFEDN